MEKESQDREREREPDSHFQRVFVERKSEFSDCKSDSRARGSSSFGHSLGHKNKNTRNLSPDPDIDLIHSKLNKTTEELSCLKVSHGKLQKVLSEKASELSHAVRKAEVYEREAKKLRHKLEEIRRQQRHERQERSSVSSEKEVRTGNREKHFPERPRKNASNSSITNNIVKHNAEPPVCPQQEVLNFSKTLSEELYDEIDNTFEKTGVLNVNNIYDMPVSTGTSHPNKNEIENTDKSNKEETSDNKEKVAELEKSDSNKQLEADTKLTEDNQTNHDVDSNNANNDSGGQAIYATVNMEMKKNCKRQKDCSNGNLIISDKENIVALI